MLHDLEPVDIEALLPVCCCRECVLPNGFLQVGHWSLIGKKSLFKIDKCVSGKKGEVNLLSPLYPTNWSDYCQDKSYHVISLRACFPRKTLLLDLIKYKMLKLSNHPKYINNA